MATKNKESGTPAFWEKDTKIIFCDLCLREIELGNRPTTFFNKEGWQNIMTKFKESTGRLYNIMQLKNKWDQLIKEWKIWKDLKRGSTGLGWDPVRQTIDASEEWWTERLAVVPATKKFKICGIDPELEEKLDRMFGGVVATRNYACFPSEAGFTGNAINLGTTVDFGYFTDVPSPEQDEFDTIHRSKRPRLQNKGQSGSGFLRSQISKIVTSYSSKTQVPHSTTIEEALKLLNDLPEIYEDEELYLFAVELIEDPVHREIFMKMSATRRVPYVRRLYDRLNK